MSDLYAAAALFKKRLLRRDRETLKELTDAYGGAWKRLRVDLDRLTQLIAEARERGETVSPAWLLRQARFRELESQIQAELQRFASDTELRIYRAQQVAVASAQVEAGQLVLAGMGPPPPGVAITLNRVPTMAVERLVGFMGDGSPLRTLLAVLPSQGISGAREALINGVTLGWGARKTASEMRLKMGAPLSRALTIARTETLRAYREASLETYRANGDVVEMWVWTASKSRRTCAACLAMDGREFPLSEPFGSHPNCRCSPVPKTKTWEQLGFTGIPERQRKRERGPEWFAAQPREGKLAILGPAKLAALERGEIRLEDLIGYRVDPQWGPERWERSLKAIRESREDLGRRAA